MTVQFEEVLDRLRHSLAQPLPGPSAQDRMAPLPRRTWPSFDPSRARHAAGLLLMFSIDGHAHVILTVRGALGRHGGQVSLPGGVVEPGESYEQAAIREAHEEIGLAPESVTILGRLTPIDIPVSGFRLHPIVAALAHRPVLQASDGEVARILEVPLADLVDPARIVNRPLVREGTTIEAPCFQVEGVDVWGATAMVVAEFLALVSP